VTFLVTVVTGDLLLVPIMKLWFPWPFVDVIEVYGLVSYGRVCTWNSGWVVSGSSLIGF
jgi:hypothetical protein